MAASWSILTGDCRDLLATLDASSIHTVVTSPPYFGLRDYGTDRPAHPHLMPVYFNVHIHGGSPAPIHDCQWPGCHDLASHIGNRGIAMPKMYVCERHLVSLRNLPDLDVHRASHERQPHRMRLVARGHAPWLLEGEDTTPTWDR